MIVIKKACFGGCHRLPAFAKARHVYPGSMFDGRV